VQRSRTLRRLRGAAAVAKKRKRPFMQGHCPLVTGGGVFDQLFGYGASVSFLPEKDLLLCLQVLTFSRCQRL